MTRLIAGLAVSVSLALTVVPMRAAAPQAPAAASFEVASVKPSAVDTSNFMVVPRLTPMANGRFTAGNVTLRFLVQLAYEFQDFLIVGGPSWQTSKRFDVQAKAEDGFAGTPKDMQAMLKSLLAERFGLKVHVETREMAMSVLVLAHGDGRLGPDLKPSTATCPDRQVLAQRAQELMAKGDTNGMMALMRESPCSMNPVMPTPGTTTMRMKGTGQPMSVIAQLVQQSTGRVVQDRTGLSGLYDFELELDMRAMMASRASLPAGVNLPPSNGPSLLTALQEQLGLKVNTEKGPVDVLVIDSAEEPTPN